MRKLLPGTVLCLTLALLMAGCGGSSRAAHRSSAQTTTPRRSGTAGRGTSTTPLSETRIETYSPWTAAGTLSSGVHVQEHLAGAGCRGASVFDGDDQYAWECQLASGVSFSDPCFAPPGRRDITHVACASSPWSGATVIDLAQPLSRSSWGTPTPRPTIPWAMVLANGQECGLIYGTGSEIDGSEFNYGCTAGYADDPNTSVMPFTVQYVPGSTGPLATVAVTTQWA